ncbi:MAG: glycosyltransferase [Fuerstiella sp.]
MRIAYLSDSTIPSRKANGIQVMNMCQAFANAGHDVTLFARPGEAIENDFHFYGVAPRFNIVKSATIGPQRLREWFYASRTAWQLSRCGPFDLIYGRHLPSLALAGRGRTPMIYEAHQPASLTGRVIERQLFRRNNLTRCVFISEALRTAYRKRYAQLCSVETLVSHDGTTVSLTDPELCSSTPNGGRLRVGYSGSLCFGRGIEIIVGLAQKLPYLDFHFCGGSPDEVNACRARATGSHNMTFYGFLPPSHTRAWQSSMDVLLAPYQLSVPTVEWMSPLKIFEYMATGRAVIASDVTVLREVLSDGRNALLVPPNDVFAWSNALQRLSDASVREALGQQALADLRSTYTWKLRAASVLQGVLKLAAAA